MYNYTNLSDAELLKDISSIEKKSEHPIAMAIVNKAIEENAAVIGLSALMTTTMLRMKDVIELCKEKGCSSKVIIGGACITQSYADEIGADGYSKDAAECVKLVEKLLQK